MERTASLPAPPTLFVLAATTILFGPADYLTTHYILTHGGAELNPLSSVLIGTYGFEAFFYGKLLAGGVFALTWLWTWHSDRTQPGRPQHTTLLYVVLTITFTFVLFVVTGNLAVILWMS